MSLELSYEMGMIGLLFFFTIFVAIAIWVLLPRNKQRLEKLKNIPLEDENGRR